MSKPKYIETLELMAFHDSRLDASEKKAIATALIELSKRGPTTPVEPEFLFKFPIGPWRRYFAWTPKKTYDGVIVMGSCIRRAYQTKDYLDGPMSTSFVYACHGEFPVWEAPEPFYYPND